MVGFRKKPLLIAFPERRSLCPNDMLQRYIRAMPLSVVHLLLDSGAAFMPVVIAEELFAIDVVFEVMQHAPELGRKTLFPSRS